MYKVQYNVSGRFVGVILFPLCAARVSRVCPVCVPCVSRLPPVSFYRFKDTGMANEREREPGEPGHTRDFLPRPGTVLYRCPN